MDDLAIMPYTQYWGKTGSGEGAKFHYLAYHSLDVSYVAQAWWFRSRRLFKIFHQVTGGTLDEARLQAWVLFFIALHDLGKWDVRFQLKAPEIFRIVRPDFCHEDCLETTSSIKNFDHGSAGLNSFFRDQPERCTDSEIRIWLSAVTGHHGTLVRWTGTFHDPEADDSLIEQDKSARRAWVKEMERMFLQPAGLSLSQGPPQLSTTGQIFLAGFCSVADWLASQNAFFPYIDEWMDIDGYWQLLPKRIMPAELINTCGLQKNAADFRGIRSLLGLEKPRQIQNLVDDLPVGPGLTIIEAPTGSGKTEAGMAYAWRMLAEGHAESIVFALPTQATANAMLDRVIAMAEQMFSGQDTNHSTNIVLAHGKSRLNPEFARLVEQGKRFQEAPAGDEASVQCAAWLASSRKRVFLGQIGICTIDQVLLSVLPVRHNFIRTLGLGRSILIVDEVHAYDSYMYGLLETVLRRQSEMGGSAVLLSATLSSAQKQSLLSAWGCTDGELSASSDAPYPLITRAEREGAAAVWQPETAHLPPERKIFLELVCSPKCILTEQVLSRALAAAKFGALVAVICNSVDEAQECAAKLRLEGYVPVDLFHSRFRFRDRQELEQRIMRLYGKNRAGGNGRILVATQVIEQSLDLDFDFMITQICPTDLLFQRLGRLHRHQRPHRPHDMADPRGIVVTSEDGIDFGVSGLIYQDPRLLWRTARLIEACGGNLVFPKVYRPWIEAVYAEDSQPEEPPGLTEKHEKYAMTREAARINAIQLTHWDVKPYDDREDKIAVLTRDGEAQRTVVLLDVSCGNERLIDGRQLSRVAEWERDEVLSMESIPVPGTSGWLGRIPPVNKVLGVSLIPVVSDGKGGWYDNQGRLYYHPNIGLRREKDEPVA